MYLVNERISPIAEIERRDNNECVPQIFVVR